MSERPVPPGRQLPGSPGSLLLPLPLRVHRSAGTESFLVGRGQGRAWCEMESQKAGALVQRGAGGCARGAVTTASACMRDWGGERRGSRGSHWFSEVAGTSVPREQTPQ